MLNGMNRNAAGEQEIQIIGAGEESDEDKDQDPNNRDSKDEEKKKRIAKIKFSSS